MGKSTPSFNAQAFLDSAGLSEKIVEYGRAEVIFSQGDRCESVMYIQKGAVKLSVFSEAGREAVVAMLGPGDFFGEGCLAGQPIRIGSATAITPSSVLVIEKKQMARYGKQDKPRQVVPKISQETLSEMVGTTRSRVNFFMNKFKRLGFINYKGDLDAGVQINSSLLSVVLHD